MVEITFRSQICTTREQSERLTALGLKKETADMLIMSYSTEQDIIALPWSEAGEWTRDNSIPAWSLHRLWELTNIKHIILDSADEITKIYDVVIAYIESQIKEGVFNKNYLEDN